MIDFHIIDPKMETLITYDNKESWKDFNLLGKLGILSVDSGQSTRMKHWEGSGCGFTEGSGSKAGSVCCAVK